MKIDFDRSFWIVIYACAALALVKLITGWPG